MSMEDPSPRTSRLILTAGFVAAIAIGGAGFVLGQRAATERVAVEAEIPARATVPLAKPPEVARRVLGRHDLILLAAAAGDAAVGGATLPAETGATVGDRFSIALPFGCGGPANPDSAAAMRWRYDQEAGALRLHVAPVRWPAREWTGDRAVAVESETEAEDEAVEGFWIARPWTSSEACPAKQDGAASGDVAVLPATQTLAIGQFIGGAEARGGRDGRAYTSVLRMAADAVRGDLGFRLRLSGRIAAAPGGGTVICQQPNSAEQRPICLVLAIFDSVVIENAATGERLAIWDVAVAGHGGQPASGSGSFG